MNGINAFIKVLTDILVYTALYIPFLYCIFGAVLYVWYGLTFSPANTATYFYYIGLIICFLASFAITIKKLYSKLDNATKQLPEKRRNKRKNAVEEQDDTVVINGTRYAPIKSDTAPTATPTKKSSRFSHKPIPTRDTVPPPPSNPYYTVPNSYPYGQFPPPVYFGTPPQYGVPPYGYNGIPPRTVYPPQNGVFPPQFTPSAFTGQMGQNAQPQGNPQEEQKRGFFAKRKPQAKEQAGVSPQSIMLNGEMPKVYRHKRYPDVIIFEYSDRVNYYGNNGRELVFFKTIYKRGLSNNNNGN